MKREGHIRLHNGGGGLVNGGEWVVAVRLVADKNGVKNGVQQKRRARD